MAQITLIHEDALTVSPVSADLLFTDPPYEMDGARVAAAISRHHVNHLVLITTMRQLLEFVRADARWRLSFDAVLDCAVPKKSKSLLQPHYTHQTVAYFVNGRTGSAFNRKRRQRDDVADANGYWPTIIRSPRQDMGRVSYGKNISAITDLLGSFDVQCVVDPFAGGGSTGLAAFDLGIDATLIERDAKTFDALTETFRFIGANICKQNQ